MQRTAIDHAEFGSEVIGTYAGGFRLDSDAGYLVAWCAGCMHFANASGYMLLA